MRLTWNSVGKRFYETGIDRGVLYVPAAPVLVAPRVVQSAVAGPVVAGSLSVTLPGAPTTGNMLVLVTNESQIAGASSALAPINFVPRVDTGAATAPTDDRNRIQIFTKIVVAGDSATVFVPFSTPAASFDNNELVLMEIAGADSVYQTSSGVSLTGVAPNIFAPSNSLVITAAARDSGSIYGPVAPFALVRRTTSGSNHELDVASAVIANGGTLAPAWSNLAPPARVASISFFTAPIPSFDPTTFVGVEWPGLISVTENSSGGDTKPFYLDGVKYANSPESTEFEAQIKAILSPPEFDPCDGIITVNGLSITDQPRYPFGLSYRTLIGNDIDGTSKGYKIHLVYNARVKPPSKEYATIDDSAGVSDLSWDITTKPVIIVGRKPTAHFVIDSTKTSPADLAAIEDILYGTSGTSPRLPAPSELVTLFA